MPDTHSSKIDLIQVLQACCGLMGVSKVKAGLERITKSEKRGKWKIREIAKCWEGCPRGEKVSELSLFGVLYSMG